MIDEFLHLSARQSPLQFAGFIGDWASLHIASKQFSSTPNSALGSPASEMPMAYCFNPDCTHPENPKATSFCRYCGASLLLKDRYQALKPLGRGGMGRTFLGRDRHLPSHPPCAIKQLYLQQSHPKTVKKAVQLFRQEAVRLHDLGSHPQIPRLLAHFEQRDRLYLIQELIEGQPLNPSLWQQGGNLETKTWQLLKGLLPVLQFIHDRNVIHRDIKPENIIQRSGDRQLVLIDFGIARLFTETAIVGKATIVGTPGFMAPEQMRGKVLPASDLYSLGVTCIHLLTGVDPDEMFDVVTERWQWRQHLPSNASLSPKLTKVLNQLIEPSLRYRSQSARQVLQEMGETLPSLPAIPSVADPSSLSPQITDISNLPTVAFHVEKTAQQTVKARIDYTQLKTLLARRKWKAADRETWSILCRLVGKTEGTYLFGSDIARLPCQDLNALDVLWFRASQGRFGFRVQRQIYQDVGGEYHLFCDRVGWSAHQRLTTEDKSLKFSLRSPPGHLPSRRWIGGYSWWKHLDILVQRLEQCGIEH